MSRGCHPMTNECYSIILKLLLGISFINGKFCSTLLNGKNATIVKNTYVPGHFNVGLNGPKLDKRITTAIRSCCNEFYYSPIVKVKSCGNYAFYCPSENTISC